MDTGSAAVIAGLFSFGGAVIGAVPLYARQSRRHHQNTARLEDIHDELQDLAGIATAIGWHLSDGHGPRWPPGARHLGDRQLPADPGTPSGDIIAERIRRHLGDTP